MSDTQDGHVTAPDAKQEELSMESLDEPVAPPVENRATVEPQLCRHHQRWDFALVLPGKQAEGNDGNQKLKKKVGNPCAPATLSR